MKKMITAAVLLLALGFVIDQAVINQPPKNTLKNKVDAVLTSFNMDSEDVILTDMKEVGQLTSCSLDGKVLLNKNMMDQFDSKQIKDLIINTRKLCTQASVQ